MNTYEMAEEFERRGRELGYFFPESGKSFAATGSIYLTVEAGYNYDEEAEEFMDFVSTTVRIADHGECYCREDISIDPDGHTIDAALEFIAERVAKAQG